MKANIETVKKYLKDTEEVLSSLYCAINFSYIYRSGILVATNDKLMFCADAMFRKGLKWEFHYDKISNYSENNGAVVYGGVPFVKKIMIH
ncbi:PH domain-containing protein [Bacillus salipaludis]|uniref:PH domain-containing protein n=1 Tax=Bacillus salipaludis TaxID=2547811 RepID=UPI002E228A1D|nr:PH domain-containing protein [Bacillus salipaludis]